MKPVSIVVVTFCFLLSFRAALAGTNGSVEPFASDAVLDIGQLEVQALDIRTAFAARLAGEQRLNIGQPHIIGPAVTITITITPPSESSVSPASART